MMETKLLKISEVQMLRAFYPRTGPDSILAQRYADFLKAGAVFPPVTVGRLNNRLILVDGWHRILSRIILSMDSVDAEIFNFDSERDLFAEAVNRNQNHGKSLAPEDRRRCIKRLQRYKFSVEEITKLTSVSVKNSVLSYSGIKELRVKTPSGKLLAVPIVPSIPTHNKEGQSSKSAEEIGDLISKAVSIAKANGFYDVVLPLERALNIVRGYLTEYVANPSCYLGEVVNGAAKSGPVQ